MLLVSKKRRRPNPSASPGPPSRRSRVITSTTPPTENLNTPIIPAPQLQIETYLNNQMRQNTNPPPAIFSTGNNSLCPQNPVIQTTGQILSNSNIQTTNQQNSVTQVAGHIGVANTPNQSQVIQPLTETVQAANQIVSDSNSQMPAALAAQIAQKRLDRLTTSQPEEVRFIQQIDSVSNLTNTDLFMLNWQKNHIFPELVGDVIYAHRGPTPKHGWDRADCHVEIGREGEKEKISIFSWKNYADRLQEAKLNDRVKFKNLLVVPETTNRQQWTGSVEIKLKLIASSSIEIIQRQQNNCLETGPSSSAVIYASQTGAGQPRDDEEEEAVEYVG